MTQERKERALRMHWLREEVSRISNVTLAGTFANEDDRLYWVNRVRKLNSELSALEDSMKPGRIISKRTPK